MIMTTDLQTPEIAKTVTIDEADYLGLLATLDIMSRPKYAADLIERFNAPEDEWLSEEEFWNAVQSEL
jgi:hypothetical protein